MATSAADQRRWVIEQWKYLYGVAPTADELNYAVGPLLNGTSRSAWLANAERQVRPDDIKRLFKETLGREPTPQEQAKYANLLKQGKSTRKAILQELAGSTEALLRTPEEAPDPAKENARDYLNSVLKDYGLEGMGDWAWQQIQEGYSETRILQNLRDTDQYKQRFVGMEARKANGLSAISEAEYIAYERDTRQLMRAAGMPADFYDSPDDFARFIGDDISVSEMNSRITEGYAAAASAPAEVRAELQRLYGVGEGQLAAYFLDPDRALPLIQRQWSATQSAGAAVRSGYGQLDQTEAERLAAWGTTAEQAEQGFGTLADADELFNPLAGQDEAVISREQQQSAVFGGDADARSLIERRGQARKSAGGGAQAFALGQEGVSALGK